MKELILLTFIIIHFSCSQQPIEQQEESKQVLPETIELKEVATQKDTFQLDSNFIYLKQYIPSLVLDLRYANSNNFVGQPIRGYKQAKAILSKQAAIKLKKVQEELKTKELGLKVFDAYRPQKAVNHFVEWARDLTDTVNKQQCYPNICKIDLFQAGYISTKSGHTRGSTVDVTLINLKTGQELDMGSAYDLFDSISNTFTKKISPEQSANRKLLRNTMLKHGFYSYLKEWWHFTSWNEPFKGKYFNFDVQ